MAKGRSLTRQIVSLVMPLLILAGGITVFVLSILLRPAPALQPERKMVPTVETITVAPFDGQIDIEVDGSVVPHREITLATEVAGRIVLKSERCRAGRVVHEQELLFEVDPQDYQLEVNRLQQEQTQAEDNLSETDVDIENNATLVELAIRDLELQTNEVGRLRSLVDNRAVTVSELDQALRGQVGARNAQQILRNRGRLLEAQRKRIETSLQLAKTKLQKAELDLRRTKIVSPINGVIVEEMVEENSYVQRGATLVQIEDTDAVEVKCNLRADQLRWMWRHNGEQDGAVLSDVPGVDDYELPRVPATIIYRLGDDEYLWEGVLSRYDGIGLDPRTRTVPCRVLVDAPTVVQMRDAASAADSANKQSTELHEGGPRALVRGMFVRVVLHATPDTSLLRLPLDAVRPGDTVWLTKENNLRIVPVRVAQVLRDCVLLNADEVPVKVGDRVVVSPMATVADGMEVAEKIDPRNAQSS